MRTQRATSTNDGRASRSTMFKTHFDHSEELILELLLLSSKRASQRTEQETSFVNEKGSRESTNGTESDVHLGLQRGSVMRVEPATAR